MESLSCSQFVVAAAVLKKKKKEWLDLIVCRGEEKQWINKRLYSGAIQISLGFNLSMEW